MRKCSTSSSNTVPSRGDQCLCRQKGNPQMKVNIMCYEQLVLTYPRFNHNTWMGANLIGDSLLTFIAASLHTWDNHISVYFYIYPHICTQGIHITVPSQLLEWRYHLDQQGHAQAVGVQGAPPDPHLRDRVFSMYLPSTSAQRAKKKAMKSESHNILAGQLFLLL